MISGLIFGVDKVNLFTSLFFCGDRKSDLTIIKKLTKLGLLLEPQ
jgi:hypothetical protein